MDSHSYDSESLRNCDEEEQYELMEAWFRARFEDPAQRTPYDSGEGGYIWIWGGPYDAREELHEEFQGTVPDAVIDKLVDSLHVECFEWAPTEQPEDYDHALFDAVSQNWLARQTLDEALAAIESLLTVSLSVTLVSTHRRLLFANAITALETFLSDTFINRVLGNSALLQAYIDSEPKFKERRVPFKDVLREAERVTDEARKELLNVSWHNVSKVKAMYAQVLCIDLGDIGKISAAVQVRHDIVHRNGRQKDGTLILVETTAIESLVKDIRTIAARVELALNPIAPADIDGEVVF